MANLPPRVVDKDNPPCSFSGSPGLSEFKRREGKEASLFQGSLALSLSFRSSTLLLAENEREFQETTNPMKKKTGSSLLIIIKTIPIKKIKKKNRFVI